MIFIIRLLTIYCLFCNRAVDDTANRERVDSS